MSRKRIAIACQGGGSQCAFIAGALDALFEQGIGAAVRNRRPERNLRWRHHRRARRGWRCSSAAAAPRASVGARIVAFWKDLSAQTPQELAPRQDLHRPGAAGRARPPAQRGGGARRRRLFELWSRTTSLLISRPEFTDLRTLLGKHLDFDALPRLMAARQPGAAGRRRRRARRATSRCSARRISEIRMEALLASSALSESVPGGVGRWARLLGRHLRHQPAHRLLPADGVHGRSPIPRRSGSSR